ncbi:MAG: nitrogenase molybdenum-iron protein subunit beta [Rhodospirillales bacterium]|nr:nitrogenase molybdenum-iron protein subunit beta [Rhodospirillales bacterium]
MPQSTEAIKDHVGLFREPEYKEMLRDKRANFECPHPPETVEAISAWTKSDDYREKNFDRKALVINPAKACQPLGAVFCSSGFEGTLSFVHGSQGCVAYYRSHLSRHFKEPTSAVSSSMTEDAAVFGGLNNMIEGLANAFALYEPKMIAVSTTCMAEVIGDDLHAFIGTAKEKGSVPADFNVPFAHTPAFQGSHVNGYDNMLLGILRNFWESDERTPGAAINIIPGFDGYCVGNNRELARLLDVMDVAHTILCDPSDVFDTPSDGTFRMYDGGTTIDETKAALNAKATLSLQEFCTKKTLAYAKEKGHEVASLHYPIGVEATDELLMAISRIAGKPIPDSLLRERGRLVDALTDSMSIAHGKTFAVFGDPDFVYGMCRFLMEMGAEPRHALATNGTKPWAKQMKAMLESSPYGKDCEVWPACDLWHMRSLLNTAPVDFLIGSSYGKYLERDTGTPLIRLTFPIFDRHHHHRFPTWGYQGGLHVLVRILDTILDRLDADTNEAGVTDISFDLTR